LQTPDEAGQQRKRDQAGSAAETVPCDELACAIPGGVGGGADRQAAAIAREVVAERRHRHVAIRGADGGRLGDDAGQFGIRWVARQRFAQHRAEAVDVGGDADALAGGLLGAGVAGGEHARGTLQPAFAAVDQLGDAEVEQFDLAGLIDHHVGRLEIAVDDQVLVRMLDRGADALDQLDAGIAVRASAAQVGVKCFAAHVLDDQIGLARLGFAAIDQAGDVGMVECGQDLPLLAQAAHAVLRWKAADQLDRGLLREPAFVALREQHRAHAAAAEFAQNSPGTDALAAEVGRDAGFGVGAQCRIDGSIGRGIGREQRAQARRLFGRYCVQLRLAPLRVECEQGIEPVRQRALRVSRTHVHAVHP
jgi:hypothetical protein